MSLLLDCLWVGVTLKIDIQFPNIRTTRLWKMSKRLFTVKSIFFYKIIVKVNIQNFYMFLISTGWNKFI